MESFTTTDYLQDMRPSEKFGSDKGIRGCCGQIPACAMYNVKTNNLNWLEISGAIIFQKGMIKKNKIWEGVGEVGLK